MASTSKSAGIPKKRLIICCDGTWMNSDTGYKKPTLWNPVGKLQTPSNVTRLSRSLRRICNDGKIQIIEYQSGVGTSGSIGDLLSGGAFGLGISENIRAAYSFICANYCDGDQIILLGFSRGAFTARSIAGMVSDLGLLTRSGMEYFYPIYKDMQNWRTPDYEDPFPGVPFDNKPTGEGAGAKYRQMLIDRGLTRVYEGGGKGPMIKIRAVAVFDTVGSLGVPNVGILAKLGLYRSTKEFRFYDTALSDRIEYAFQALALDEHRLPFAPSVWERTAANKGATDLRQVWFPGNHGNIGGGWADSGIANISFAWMMDQLASIGVEFDEASIERIFTQLERYYRDEAKKKDSKIPHMSSDPIRSDSVVASQEELEGDDGPLCGDLFSSLTATIKHWAMEPIYENNVPIRPWSLGALKGSQGKMAKYTGYDMRLPGLYKKPDPETGGPTTAFLEDTNERVHSSVRVRLALKGLGLNDEAVWSAPALKGKWHLQKTTERFADPIPHTVATWEPQRPLSALDGDRGRWIWEYCGPEKDAPPDRILVEEPLGPFERQLLRLAGGTPNVYEFAEGITVEGFN
ncbi:hypothetical protein B0T17DRAFT_591195 [Bombardia bombarda]|uniref:T6SS Phospholipase effector Tle1-like catalytic domain-containing protein n=1 Tax=Bombardia bombarda TaxID=252184 RepID=A0AA40C1Q8_9PEZI|nr:hypothetical protein B0T17DRAFT_591195 [Bombardia bombarda]